jgi:uncharacterized membrane protein YfcA
LPLGAWLARSITPRTVDRLTLAALIILVVKLILFP